MWSLQQGPDPLAHPVSVLQPAGPPPRTAPRAPLWPRLQRHLPRPYSHSSHPPESESLILLPLCDFSCLTAFLSLRALRASLWSTPNNDLGMGLTLGGCRAVLTIILKTNPGEFINKTHTRCPRRTPASELFSPEVLLQPQRSDEWPLGGALSRLVQKARWDHAFRNRRQILWDSSPVSSLVNPDSVTRRSRGSARWRLGPSLFPSRSPWRGGHSGSLPQGMRSPPSVRVKGPPGSEQRLPHGRVPGASVRA